MPVKFRLITLSLGALLLSACASSGGDSAATGQLDEFASCLTESGATFYGTEWCSHCQKQKTLFGNSMSKVNFVDCDVSSVICRKEGITGYPTWKFSDGSALSGTQTIETLAEKTGCTLPVDDSTG